MSYFHHVLHVVRLKFVWSSFNYVVLLCPLLLQRFNGTWLELSWWTNYSQDGSGWKCVLIHIFFCRFSGNVVKISSRFGRKAFCNRTTVLSCLMTWTLARRKHGNLSISALHPIWDMRMNREPVLTFLDSREYRKKMGKWHLKRVWVDVMDKRETVTMTYNSHCCTGKRSWVL